MADQSAGGELYSGQLIGMLELIWGEGWLSPGGPEEVATTIKGIDFRGKTVLDIGCGVGGVGFLLIETHGARYITGIDVEDTVLMTARRRAETKGLTEKCGFAKVWPGPLAFPPASFDIVFSKDAVVHIPDKHALMRDAFRILKPGGWFVASDWLVGHDGPLSPEMKAYVAAEGLDFGMASPQRYQAALTEAGFANIAITSRNEWYRQTARTELAQLKGPLYGKAVDHLGKDFVDHNIEIWAKMLVVLDTGEHCPTHLRGQKPV